VSPDPDWREVEALLDELNEEARTVLLSRMGLDRGGEPRTIAEVVEQTGIEPGVVRRIEHEALAQVRARATG
jgi:DNA-directed RNA polymerase sigma subunit (sigma70/sigma32)